MYMFEEAIPDCVPEFYRSRQEDAEHKYELLTCCQERCRANRQKLDEAAAAGLPILSYGGDQALIDYVQQVVGMAAVGKVY